MLPGRIRIGWREYEVVEVEEIINDEAEDCAGHIDYCEEIIEIKSDMKDTQKACTLFHELIHHCLYATGHFDAKNDEEICTAISEQFMQLFTDNPYLIHQLFNLGGVQE